MKNIRTTTQFGKQLKSFEKTQNKTNRHKKKQSKDITMSTIKFTRDLDNQNFFFLLLGETRSVEV